MAIANAIAKSSRTAEVFMESSFRLEVVRAGLAGLFSWTEREVFYCCAAIEKWHEIVIFPDFQPAF